MMLQHACAAAQHAGKGCRGRCTWQRRMIWNDTSAHFHKYETLHVCHRLIFYSSARCTQRSGAAVPSRGTEAATSEVLQQYSSIQSYVNVPSR